MKSIKILLFLFPFYFYSQQKVFFVYDKLTNEPIPFVNVKLYKNDVLLKGFYSNVKGKIEVENFNKINKIEISSVGFENFNLPLGDINLDTIYLKKETIQLNEVILTADRINNFKEMGYHLNKKKSDYSTTSGMETVVYIENEEKKNFKIKSVLAKIKRRKNHTSIVKICLYESRRDSIFPSDIRIGSSNFYYLEGNSKKEYEFDLESLNIEMPLEGIFVGIEWIGIYDKENNVFLKDETFDTNVELNDIINNPMTFSRNVLNDKKGWSNLSKNLLKYTDIEYENYPNLSFGIKVFSKD